MSVTLHTLAAFPSRCGGGTPTCHLLKNRTTTRLLDGKTPYEALHGNPPDLSVLCPSSSVVWGAQRRQVEAEPSSERGQVARLRYGSPSAPHLPDTRAVSIERDVNFGSSAQLEEELRVPTSGAERSAALPNSIAPLLEAPEPISPLRASQTRTCHSAVAIVTHPKAFVPRARALGRHRPHLAAWPHPSRYSRPTDTGRP